jgi:hypothetical protein
LTTTILKDPPASASAERHADWLELLALKSRDRTSSIQDIQRVFSRSGTTDAVDLDRSGDDDDEEDRGSERSQAIAEDAFSEIERRRGAAGVNRYPFAIAEQSLSACKDADTSIYVFLLLLTQFGKDAGPAGLDGDELFEGVAATAAQQYFGGDNRATAYQFGFPRRVAPAGFRAALDDLCERAGDGGGSKDRPRRKAQKDAHLDLVVWNDFEDMRPGKLITFAQCATGSNWKNKLTELQPHTWCNLWMQTTPLPHPVRSFFVPHSVEADYWPEAIGYGGIMFDRTRIARFAELSKPLAGDVTCWCRAALKAKLRG